MNDLDAEFGQDDVTPSDIQFTGGDSPGGISGIPPNAQEAKAKLEAQLDRSQEQKSRATNEQTETYYQQVIDRLKEQLQLWEEKWGDTGGGGGGGGTPTGGGGVTGSIFTGGGGGGSGGGGGGGFSFSSGGSGGGFSFGGGGSNMAFDLDFGDTGGGLQPLLDTDLFGGTGGGGFDFGSLFGQPSQAATVAGAGAGKDYLTQIAAQGLTDTQRGRAADHFRTAQAQAGLLYGGAAAKQEAAFLGRLSQQRRLQATQQLMDLTEAESAVPSQIESLLLQSQQLSGGIAGDQLTSPLAALGALQGGQDRSLASILSFFGGSV